MIETARASGSVCLRLIVDTDLLILQNYWTNRDALLLPLLPLLSLLRVPMLLHVYAADDRQVRTSPA